MILNLIPHALGLAVLALMFYPFFYCVADPNHLRRFPAPSGAAVSTLWRVWHNLRQRHYAAVHQAHARLGTHVRIAPNHISILHPEAPRLIYGHGANMMKEAWYDAGAGPHRNLADAWDKVQHQGKRKMLAHVFAAKTVVAFEPQLMATLNTLRMQLDRHADTGSPLNMRLYLNYFTIDFFGKLLYGVDFGCLDRGNDLLDAETPHGTIYKVSFIQSLLDGTTINTFLAMSPSLLSVTRPLLQTHPYKKAGVDWENIVYHNTKRRWEESEGDDLFSRLMQNTQGKSLNLPFGEVVAECSAMMNAGNYVTNSTHLLPAGQPPTYDTASRLPYLRACIEESLRVRPASSFGLPRVVPEGGRNIAGQFVPGGVTVSVPTYSLLRDESVFENADKYIPERWMTEDAEKKSRMANNHLPFSTGPRACIGRNIAYFEQIVVVATIVKYYDCVVPEGFQLETQERFNSNAGDLVVKVRPRRASNIEGVSP